MKIAVFVSGNGSNLQALLDAEASGTLGKGKISLVISDNPEAAALKRASNAGKQIFVLEPKDFNSRERYDEEIIKKLKEKKIEGVVLAGFMRILSGIFVNQYKYKILNIHPSLLPKFKGAHAIRAAFKAGEKETGVTVHFVTQELDAGPIILQEKVVVTEKDTAESLEEKIHKVEHRLYPEAVKLFAQGKVNIKDDKVDIKV